MLIMLYFLLIYQIIRVALDINIPFYSYICAGVCSMILFHVLENIGMTIGLLPITGIPLLLSVMGKLTSWRIYGTWTRVIGEI